MKYIQLFTTLLGIGVLNSVSFAESGPQDYPIKIKNKAQAVKVSEGRKVAFVCEGCETFQPSTMDKKKSFLSFLNSNYTQLSRLRRSGNRKGTARAKYQSAKYNGIHPRLNQVWCKFGVYVCRTSIAEVSPFREKQSGGLPRTIEIPE